MIFTNLKKKTMALILIFAGILLSILPATAQQTNQIAESETRISVEGVVIDASTGMGLPDVVVEITELNAKARTNQEGKFILNTVAPVNKTGIVTLNIDQQGFKELSRRINLQKTDEVVLAMKVKYPIE